MTQDQWGRLVALADDGLAKALEEGRGVDALAMMEAREKCLDHVRSFAEYERMRAMQSAQGQGPRR